MIIINIVMLYSYKSYTLLISLDGYPASHNNNRHLKYLYVSLLVCVFDCFWRNWAGQERAVLIKVCKSSRKRVILLAKSIRRYRFNVIGLRRPISALHSLVLILMLDILCQYRLQYYT